MKAINLSRNACLAQNLELADSSWSRMKGLLGRRRLPEGCGLLITRCNAIHMFFMHFSIDVVFLDSSDHAVGLVRSIPPFAMSPVFWKAVKALELPAGVIDSTRTEVGDSIAIS